MGRQLSLVLGFDPTSPFGFEAAKVIKEQLDPFLGNAITIHLLVNDDASASPLETAERLNHERVDIVVLLCAKAGHCHDWSNLLSGAYGAATADRNDTVLMALYTPTVSIPTVLEKQVKFFRATKQGTREFLTDLIERARNFPEALEINEIAENLMSAVIGAIVDKFEQKGKKVWGEPENFGRYLVLVTEPLEDRRVMTEETLENAVIDAASPTALEVFGLRPLPNKQRRWGDLLEAAGLKDRNKPLWVSRLPEILSLAEKGALLKPIDALFISRITKKAYSLSLIYRSEASDGSSRFFINLVEQPEKKFVQAEDPYRTLLSTMNLASRLHWEVTNEFLKRLSAGVKSVNMKRFCQELEDRFDDVQLEGRYREAAESEQLLHEDQDRLVLQFNEEDKRRATAEQNLAEQSRVKEELKMELAKRDAASAEDLTKILQRLQQLNKELYLIIGGRYLELLEVMGQDENESPG